MQGQREHTLGYSSGSTAWRNDDRNASYCGRRQIDVVDTDTGPCDDAQPWGAREKRGIDNGVGTDYRADGIGEILRAWIGDECDFVAEDPSDQRRIHGAECHDHRRVDNHDPTRALWRVSGSPNVAPATAGTCCHVPRSAEAAAAAMTCSKSEILPHGAPPLAVLSH